MSVLMAISKRRVAFVHEFLRNGGKGRQAAIAVGYSKTGAHNLVTTLLQDSLVLALILSGVCSKTRGGDEVLRRLMMPSRSGRTRLTVQHILSDPENMVGLVYDHKGRPCVVVDPDMMDDRVRMVRAALAAGVATSKLPRRPISASSTDLARLKIQVFS